MGLNWEITFQLLVLISLAILISKAFEIRNLLEELTVKIAKLKD